MNFTYFPLWIASRECRLLFQRPRPRMHRAKWLDTFKPQKIIREFAFHLCSADHSRGIITHPDELRFRSVHESHCSNAKRATIVLLESLHHSHADFIECLSIARTVAHIVCYTLFAWHDGINRHFSEAIERRAQIPPRPPSRGDTSNILPYLI